MAQRRWVSVVGTFVVGALAACQIRVNGALGVQLDDGVAAGAVSFATGLVVLAVVVSALPGQRGAVGRLWEVFRAGGVPIWMLVACMGAAVSVLGQTLVGGIIGVTMFSIGIVAGRGTTAIVIDAVGLGPGGARRITAGRVIGSIVSIAAVLVVPVLGSLGADRQDLPPVWMIGLAFVAGAGLAFQQAANGGLRQRSGSGLVSTSFVFLVGTVLFGMLFLVRIPLAGVPQGWPANPVLYIGGVIGAVFIVFSAILVSRVGVLLLGLGSIVGQLATALVLDQLWPSADAPSPLLGLLAVAVALVGGAIAAEPWRNRVTARAM